MTKNFDQLATFLSKRFGPVLLANPSYTSDGPPHKDIKSEASVLILLDKRDDDWYIFLTLRSEKLRSYAGEVSFPGGKRETGDRSYIDTALREAHEETGLPHENVEIIGTCMPILSKLLILVHPVFAILKSNFVAIPNDEVQKCFWLPLRDFLAEEYHETIVLMENFKMNRFNFPNDIVYGLTAYLCIITSILVYDRLPEFSFLNHELPLGESKNPIGSIVRKLFDIELKQNMDFVFDVKEYMQKGRKGKL